MGEKNNKEKSKVKFKNIEEDSKLDTLSIKKIENFSNVNNNNNNQAEKSTSIGKVTKKIKNIYEVSKCGFQGAKIDKTNQDNFVVTKNILNEKETYFFAVL